VKSKLLFGQVLSSFFRCGSFTICPAWKKAEFIAVGFVMALTSVIAADSSLVSATRSERLWKPAADDVYLQEIGQQIVTEKPVTSVAIHSNSIYAVIAGELKQVQGTGLSDLPGGPRDITRLRIAGSELWALTKHGVYRLRLQEWEQIATNHFVDLCLHLGKIFAATPNALFRFEDGKFVDIRPEGGYLSTDSTLVMEDFTQVLADPVEIGPVQRIASYSGTLYMLRSGKIALIDGKTFSTDTVDWGTLPSPVTRDMLAIGSQLYIGTDRGVGVLRGMSLTSLRGAEGLPYEDTTCLARGFDNELWIGTTRGAIRKLDEQFHYFGAHHWLPTDRVSDIAVGDRVVCIGTDGGLGVIRYEPYTLASIAAFF
jgi:hypothetical protein